MRHKKSIGEIILKFIIIILVLFILIGPLIGIFLWSFAQKWYWPNPIPQDFGLKYWMQVFQQGRISNSIILSTIIALLTVVFSIIISIPAAYGFARYSFPLEKLLLIIFLMPQAFPQLPVFINLANIFSRIGLRGNMWGIILAHTMASMVFSIWIITATFRAIPEELEQAARNLGANIFKTFWTITMPMAIPGIIAGSIFVFLWSMGEFTAAFFIGAPFIQTAPVLMYTASMGYNLQIASVISIILLIPSLIFMIMIEKYLKAEYISGLGG